VGYFFDGVCAWFGDVEWCLFDVDVVRAEFSLHTRDFAVVCCDVVDVHACVVVVGDNKCCCGATCMLWDCHDDQRHGHNAEHVVSRVDEVEFPACVLVEYAEDVCCRDESEAECERDAGPSPEAGNL